MKPEDVKPNMSQNLTILYDSGNFAIASGKYEDVENALLMRWNGDTESDIGYPNAHGNPMWFRVENKLAFGILTSLLSQEKSNKQELLDAIQKIINKGK